MPTSAEIAKKRSNLIFFQTRSLKIDPIKDLFIGLANITTKTLELFELLLAFHCPFIYCIDLEL